MQTPTIHGPSGDAWGTTLTDPCLVSYQGYLLAFARAAGRPTAQLYFKVLDPSSGVDGSASPGDDAWVGWFRHDLPGAPPPEATNQRDWEEQHRPEVRPAGMGLLTVPPEVTSVHVADAPFQVVADEQYLYVFRLSSTGTLYVDRLVLRWEAGEEVDGGRRYWLETPWEVRFQHTRKRDVPLDDTDPSSPRDLVGEPFLEPTLELGRIRLLGVQGFGVARVPVGGGAVWYVARAGWGDVGRKGILLSRFGQTDGTVTDLGTEFHDYQVIAPALTDPHCALDVVDELAPAVTCFGEQDPHATTQDGDVELKRAGRLMLAFAVQGCGLDRATAVYDFALDEQGYVADLPGTEQVAPLVDGRLVDGRFEPDDDAPRYPRPEQLPETVRLVDRRLVQSMVLGQVQPRTDLVLRTAESGQVELYYGGATVSGDEALAGWRLIPGQAEAQVAVFDPRVSRVVLDLPWEQSVRTDQPAGAVHLVANRCGALMDGTSVTVTGVTFDGGGEGQAQPALCELRVTYPAATGFPAEVWTGLPRDVEQLLRVLDGQASDDAADPDVLSGKRPFFDFSGTRGLARLALEPLDVPGATAEGDTAALPPVLTLVSSRSTVPLAKLEVTEDGDGRGMTMFFQPSDGPTIVLRWPGLPAAAAAYPGILAGAAGPSVYGYRPGTGTTRLYALATDAYQVGTPLLCYPAGPTPPPDDLAVVVARGDAPGTLDVTLEGLPGTPTFTVPADVTGFVAALEEEPAWRDLGLVVDHQDAAGRVLPARAEPLDLRAAAALFDVVPPGVPLNELAVAPGTYAGGRLRHRYEGGAPAGEDAPGPATRMLGFAALGELPDTGAPAYVRDLATGEAVQRLNRRLDGDGGVAQSGAWIRRTPPHALSLDGTAAMNVPVEVLGGAIPAANRLAPQRDWSAEVWLHPSGAGRQRLLTFHESGSAGDGVPSRDYRIDVATQEAIAFLPHEPGDGEFASFYSTDDFAADLCLPDPEFTWELWVQPDEVPAPGDASAPVWQLNFYEDTVLGLALTAEREVVVLSGGGAEHRTGVRLPATAPDGGPAWSHLAVVGTREYGADRWSLALYVNSARLWSTTGLPVARPNSYAVAVGNQTSQRSHSPGVSAFCRVAQLRVWAQARTPADLRHTALGTPAPVAPLVACWPLVEVLWSEDQQVAYTPNAVPHRPGLARAQYAQPTGIAAGGLLSSVVATVDGLPAVATSPCVGSGRWNHLAVAYRRGGAVELNTGETFAQGRVDTMHCPEGSGPEPADRFTFDAWVRLPHGSPGGTIASRWSPDDPDGRSFRWWLERAADDSYLLSLELLFTGVDERGRVKLRGKTWTVRVPDLADAAAHALTVTVTLLPIETDPGTAPGTLLGAAMYVDGTKQGSPVCEYVRLDSCQVSAVDTPFTLGALAAPKTPADAGHGDRAPFQGILGRVRYWRDVVPPGTVPEDGWDAGTPPAEPVSEWDFREGSDRLVADRVGHDDGILSSSGLWTTLPESSRLDVLLDGRAVPVSRTDAYPAAAVEPQFRLGAPAEAGIAGFRGAVAQLGLWGTVRSGSLVAAQRFVPLRGDERGLLASWDLADGGRDTTGGSNDADPPLDASWTAPSSVPLAQGGPFARAVYGGRRNQSSVSTPGRAGAGPALAADRADGVVPTGMLLRAYLFDPADRPLEPVWLGDLALVHVGQVQSEPTLIGYIEGAPPLPSENLTRPYYLNPGGGPYLRYDGTATVTLQQQDTTTATYEASARDGSNHVLSLAAGPGVQAKASAGQFLYKQIASFEFSTLLQGKFTHVQTSSTAGARQAAWTASTRDSQAVAGDWEPYEADPQRYLNPEVGRRYEPANLGTAVVESLTADLYAATLRGSGAAVGTIVLPNPAIPPDRNLLLFPIDPRYTKAGTLDGKVGLVNDPDWPGADQRRGSYFKPAEAYALAGRVERQAQAQQAQPASARRRQPSDDPESLLTTPGNHLPVDAGDGRPGHALVPRQGIANRYVWTAGGGLHVENEGYAAEARRSFSRFSSTGGGGGVRSNVKAFGLAVGVIGSLDYMGLHQVDLTAATSTRTGAALSLSVAVEGEGYLHAWHPDAPGEAGRTGAYTDEDAAGKVTAYRFMSFYLPPDRANGRAFRGVVDPLWLHFSNNPTARAMRELDATGQAWRVLHRVTYVERVPPRISSRPLFSDDDGAREPVNIEGNALLLGLITSHLGPEPTRAEVGSVVATVLDPPPRQDGVYPAAAVEAYLPWWSGFLATARERTQGQGPNEAARMLHGMVRDVVDYVYDGYRTGVLP